MISDKDLFRLFNNGSGQPPYFLEKYNETLGTKELNRQKIDWTKEAIEIIGRQENIEDSVLCALLLREYLTGQENYLEGLLIKLIANIFLLTVNKEVSSNEIENRICEMWLYNGLLEKEEVDSRCTFLSLSGRKRAEKLLPMPSFMLEDNSSAFWDAWTADFINDLNNLSPNRADSLVPPLPIHVSAAAGKGNPQILTTSAAVLPETVEIDWDNCENDPALVRAPDLENKIDILIDMMKEKMGILIDVKNRNVLASCFSSLIEASIKNNKPISKLPIEIRRCLANFFAEQGIQYKLIASALGCSKDVIKQDIFQFQKLYKKPESE